MLWYYDVGPNLDEALSRLADTERGLQVLRFRWAFFSFLGPTTLACRSSFPRLGCHNYVAHNYIAHNYIAHNYIAHSYHVCSDVCLDVCLDVVVNVCLDLRDQGARV